MENLLITKEGEGFYKYPNIDFNAETGVCEIEGESYMDNAVAFFSPLFEWLQTYFEVNKQGAIKLIFKLKYYNTSSSRIFYDLIEFLKEYEQKGGSVIFEWYYRKGDIDIEEDIKDMEIETETTIIIKEM